MKKTIIILAFAITFPIWILPVMFFIAAKAFYEMLGFK